MHHSAACHATTPPCAPALVVICSNGCSNPRHGPGDVGKIAGGKHRGRTARPQPHVSEGTPRVPPSDPALELGDVVGAELEIGHRQVLLEVREA